jgi:hypothetical protein
MGVESALIDSHWKISEPADALNSGKPHFIEIAVTGVVDSLVDLGA